MYNLFHFGFFIRRFFFSFGSRFVSVYFVYCGIYDVHERNGVLCVCVCDEE